MLFATMLRNTKTNQHRDGPVQNLEVRNNAAHHSNYWRKTQVSLLMADHQQHCETDLMEDSLTQAPVTEQQQQQPQHNHQSHLKQKEDNEAESPPHEEHVDNGSITTTMGEQVQGAVTNAGKDVVMAGATGAVENHGAGVYHGGQTAGAQGPANILKDHHRGDEDSSDPAAKRQRLDEAGSAAAVAAHNKKVHTEQWNEMLEQMKAYKEQFGDTLVPKRYQGNPKLGTWVETQRVQYKRLPRVYDETLGHEVPQPNKRLTAERLKKLSDLGFCWSAKHIRKTGSTGSLSSSAAAAAKTAPSSTANVTMTVTEPPSAPGGVPQTVTVTLPVPVAAPAPASTTRPPAPSTANADAQWDDFYNLLVRFQQIHGHTLVPRKYEDNPKLASWVEQQRALWNRDYNQNKEKTPWPTDSAASASAGVIKRLSLERKEKLDAIGFVWSLRSKRIDDHWDEMFKQLAEYKNQHGDCLVPSRYEANLKLGKWVETQRYEYTKLQRSANSSDNDEAAVAPPNNTGGGAPSYTLPRPINPRLTPDRLRRLESIGFEWKVKNKMKRYYDKQWDAMFQKLLEFKEKYGHVNVPKRFPDDVKLGTWVHTQRIQYRKLLSGNTKGSSGKDKSGSLKSEEDSPVAQDPNASPPYTYTEEGDDPAGTGANNWTAEQAQSYRLTDARRQRLEEVGFCWSAREGNEKATLETGTGRITRNSYDDQWDAMFEFLVKYKEERGDCNVPKRFQVNPKLGTWVDTQRVQYKKLQKKIAQLQHQKQFGANGSGANNMAMDDNASVGSTSSSTGTPLVGRLTQDRINRLQALGFVWSLRDDWAKHYEELKAYREIHGHCNVPARFPENRRLGIWVSSQRQQYKILQQQKHARSIQDQGGVAVAAPPASELTLSEGIQPAESENNAGGAKARRSAPLTQERIDLLNAIGFTWTIRSRDSLGESWNQRLHELRQFKQQYGHCQVPSRYEATPELGIWVGTQRTQYRLYMRSKETGVPVATSMNEDRIRELEDMGFVWALRGNIPDETVAAAEAAATAVEIADQMAGVAAVRAVGHDPSVYHPHAQPLHHHSPFVFSHEARVHHGEAIATHTGGTNTESPSNHNDTTAANSHNEYITAI